MFHQSGHNMEWKVQASERCGLWC